MRVLRWHGWPDLAAIGIALLLIVSARNDLSVVAASLLIISMLLRLAFGSTR